MTKCDKRIVDVIGVGLGPFNLGLAALLQGVPDVDGLFFEQKPAFNWHPGMLIEGTTLQVPFLADLVTMADATSPYSFLNYLQENNRLYHFYFLERFHIPRREYNDYCQWVAGQLNGCRFGKRVDNIKRGEEYFEVDVYDAKQDVVEQFYSKHLVIGVGTVPTMPDAFQGPSAEDIFHSADFLDHQERCRRAKSIAVVGSGQSAAEVFLTLLKDQTAYGYRLDWLTRSKGFFPMEYSKLGLEHFSPDYTNYFFNLPKEKRDAVFPQQDLLYKGIDTDTIAEIYDLLYERSIGGASPDVCLQAMTEVTRIHEKPGDSGFELELYQWQQEQRFTLESDIVIAGTGYRQHVPECLSGLHSLIRWDEFGRYVVNKDYTLSLNEQGSNHIFVQNGELHTHGVGAPDLGLGAHRNAVIINKLAGRDVYPVHERNVFQHFGVKTRSEPYAIY
ncbi:MAG TPA: lysine N(6)-hydroxylase/L-ornithine N(5)-oxygenase family protein [Bacillales bacterium]